MTVLECLAAALLFTKTAVTPPALALDVEGLSVSGWYEHSTVMLRPGADCGVLVHELAHHRQVLVLGEVKDQEDWNQREREARHIEMRWRGRE